MKRVCHLVLIVVLFLCFFSCKNKVIVSEKFEKVLQHYADCCIDKTPISIEVIGVQIEDTYSLLINQTDNSKEEYISYALNYKGRCIMTYFGGQSIPSLFELKSVTNIKFSTPENPGEKKMNFFWKLAIDEDGLLDGINSFIPECHVDGNTVEIIGKIIGGRKSIVYQLCDVLPVYKKGYDRLHYEIDSLIRKSFPNAIGGLDCVVYLGIDKTGVVNKVKTEWFSNEIEGIDSLINIYMNSKVLFAPAILKGEIVNSYFGVRIKPTVSLEPR